MMFMRCLNEKTKNNRIINMNSKQQRTDRLNKIRQQLSQTNMFSNNRKQVEAKEEKIRYRRQSLQIADPFTSEKLLRKFSDQDQEEERNNINTFNEKYLLIQKIGEGANATVSTCEYRQNGKIYAVKMISMDQEHILELKRNFLSIKLLRHPNIIKYYALYFDLKKNLCYLIMEYFPFQNMIELNLRDEAQLRIVFSELLVAVNYIHQRNICHRDIKPENVLYDPFSKKVKLIDFGISRRTFQRGQKRELMTIIGTPQYLAPEILTGGGYDQKVDLWSVGVTLYKLIAKVTPFQSQYHADTVNNIVKGKLQFKQNVWNNYSFFAKDFITRLVRPRQSRLSANQALLHLWISQASPGRLRKKSQQDQEGKFPKNETFNLRVYKAFHDEPGHLNIWHAKSKEEGEQEIFGSRPTVKRISLNFIVNKEFELQDSSDEQNKSPSTVNSRDNESRSKKISF